MKTKITLIASLLLVLSFQSKAQDVVNLTTTDNIVTVLSAQTGSNIVLVVPSGYTNPQGINSIDLSLMPISITKLTLKGDGTKPTFKIKTLLIPASLSSSIKFQDLNIIGGDETAPASNYVLNNPAANAIPVVDTVAFNNCNIANCRGIVRLQTSGTTYKNIVINNCIMSNIVDYGLVTTAAGSVITNLTISKSTIYGMPSTVLNVAAGTALSTLTISDCTFDNMVNTAGKYLIDLGASNTTTVLNISNTIVGKNLNLATTGAKGIRGGTGFTYTVSNSYTTSDWVTTGNALVGFTAYANPSTSLFKTPTVYNSTAPQTTTVGDYKIIDTNFAAKNSAGDPRWYFDAVTALNDPKTSNISITCSDGTLNLSEMTNVKLFSLSGQLVRTAELTNSVLLSDLSKGIYIAKAGTECKGFSIQKFIIK